MKVQYLYFEGCPHGPPALERLEQVLGRIAPGTAIEAICIDDLEQARRLRFLGSPTIRVDGSDVEGRASGPAAMACRLYEGGGPPPEWMIEAAVLGALRPQHILFLCVANSARSQLAEGIARSLAPPSVRISSAGSRPASVRPEAVQVLSELGIDASAHRSKSVADVDRGSVDAVVTLCAEEVCPVFARPVTKLHWGLPDPAGVVGAGEARLDAFRQARDELSKRLAILFAASGDGEP